MANGHVEIHDPFASSTSRDPESTSDADSMGDTVELRILMAYAKRRRTKKKVESTTQNIPIGIEDGTHANGSTSPQTPAKTEEEEKKKTKKMKKMKKGWKPMMSILQCIRPATREETVPVRPPQAMEEPPESRCGVLFHDEVIKEEDELEDVACQLTDIADEISFSPPEVETDSPSDLERVIGLLLREAGDQLNEEELKKAFIATNVSWNYSFFERLMTALLTRMGLLTSTPDSPGPQASPKTQIAVTCEFTSRLSAAETLPMTRMLDHGARYLQKHYSSWAQQQGGYEAAFHSEDEDE